MNSILVIKNGLALKICIKDIGFLIFVCYDMTIVFKRRNIRGKCRCNKSLQGCLPVFWRK